MKCYARLSENTQACSFLNKSLPDYLKNPPTNLLDEEGKKCYGTLMKNLNDSARYWLWFSIKLNCSRFNILWIIMDNQSNHMASVGSNTATPLLGTEANIFSPIC